MWQNRRACPAVPSSPTARSPLSRIAMSSSKSPQYRSPQPRWRNPSDPQKGSPVSTHFNDVQLDALRELANIGSGNASTALSGLLGRPVDISVPVASALPLAEAVDAIGPAENEVTGVMLRILGELTGSVVLLVAPEDANTLCSMLGVEADSEWGLSALGEIGNIVGAS